MHCLLCTMVYVFYSPQADVPIIFLFYLRYFIFSSLSSTMKQFKIYYRFLLWLDSFISDPTGFLRCYEEAPAPSLAKCPLSHRPLNISSWLLLSVLHSYHDAGVCMVASVPNFHIKNALKGLPALAPDRYTRRGYKITGLIFFSLKWMGLDPTLSERICGGS